MVKPFRRWTVAVTGMNAVPDNPGPGMAVARCLSESPAFQGQLVGLGYEVLDAGLYGPRASYLLPYPSCSRTVLLERIEEIHARESLDAIIPCLDSEMPNFVALAPHLASMGITTLLPSAQALKARSKLELFNTCERLGLCHPVTRTATGRHCFRNDGWSYPLVVKGPFYGATVVHNPAQAVTAYDQIVAEWGYPVLVQEYISGHEVNLTGLGHRGRVLGEVAMRKQALTDKGKAWAGVTITDSQLSDMAARLVAGLDWNGPLEVEAMRSDEDGSLYLLEMNPRFPAWVYLSTAVGRNLPLAALSLAAGRMDLEFPPARAGAMFIRFAQDVLTDISQLESLISQGSLLNYSGTACA